jgi:hypothetical protein
MHQRLYDDRYYLERIFQAFLAENPDVLEKVRYHRFPGDDDPQPMLDVASCRRVIDWLETQGYVTDASHKAELLRILDDFEAQA